MNQTPCKPNGGSDPRADQAAAMEAQNRLVETTLAGIGNKLLIMSGKGGVGKSSLSANIAVCLAERGFKTGLMDVDLHGPSIAGIMGVSGLFDIAPDQSTIIPKQFGNNLKIVSMQSLMKDKDQAVIWRGPAKTGIIQQFIANVQWDTLDFLVIDAPPGTGDEPLTVAQTVSDAKAVIVTTPQDVALADVRKSINFCRTLKMGIAGIIENMGPFTCPCCNKPIELFKKGGGQKTATDMGVPFLGTVPFDANVVKACDTGQPMLANQKESEFSVAVAAAVDAIVKAL